LPISFLKSENDSWTRGNYPGENHIVNYAEGDKVGYRYLEANKIKARFPFGYGLSYSKFSAKVASVSRNGDSLKIHVALKNIGTRDGAEVLQLYATSGISGMKELIGFRKVFLQSHESRTIVLNSKIVSSQDVYLGTSSEKLKMIFRWGISD